MSKYAYVNGNIITNNGQTAIVCNLKNLETGKSELKHITDFKYPFYLTKQRFRNYKTKKLAEPLNRLDKYICNIGEVKDKIIGLLDFPRRRYYPDDMIFSNPYIYGANIDPRVLLKHQLFEESKDEVVSYTFGGLDTEVSVLGGEETIITQYTHMTGETYISIYKPFLKDNTLEQVKQEVNKQLNIFRDGLNDDAKKIYDTLNVNVEYKISDNEMELLKWIFSKIHYHKPDFVGIWNIDYDMPRLLKRCKFYNIDAKDIMCHPDVQPRFKGVHYKKDKKKREHFTYTWNWTKITGYTQFIDQQSLYSLLRKALPKEAFYNLEYLSTKHLGNGKVTFGNNESHAEMQQFNFVKYIAYAAVDSLLLVLLNHVLKDIEKLMMLMSLSILEHFIYPTVCLQNSFYYNRIKQGYVPASVAGDQSTEYDKLTKDKGGGVLSPEYTLNTGVPILEEIDEVTNLHKFMNGLDLSSEYPSIIEKSNIAKDTRLCTVFGILGNPIDQNVDFVRDFFTNLPSIKENSVYLCSKYFNLPNYTEMLNNIKS